MSQSALKETSDAYGVAYFFAERTEEQRTFPSTEKLMNRLVPMTAHSSIAMIAWEIRMHVYTRLGTLKLLSWFI
jgi:hypothetical protein